MGYDESFDEILDIAREKFIAGEYNSAENMLQQLLLKNNRVPEIFQMLATIYYDRGRFNKAIKTFKRALEIDPTYTDASIGLSIILNDIGRYEEGKQVFKDAQDQLAGRENQADPFLDRILAQKHEELGDIYFENKRYDEATDQYYKSKSLYDDITQISLKVADSLVKSDRASRAVNELKTLIQNYPHFIGARLKLGDIYFESNNILQAVEQWESVLLRDPQNPLAQSKLKLADESGVIQTRNEVDLC